MNAANVYKVESIETCRAPRGISEGDWCRYVVANDQSRIVGRYCGSLTQTRHNAETLAAGLNSRARSGKSAWALRGRRQMQKRTEMETATKTH